MLQATATSDSQKFNECAYMGALHHISLWLKTACRSLFGLKEEKPNKLPQAQVANDILDLLNNNLLVSSTEEMRKLLKTFKLHRIVRGFTTERLKEIQQTRESPHPQTGNLIEENRC